MKQRAIIVMGVSGCGKSTLGAMLAQALDGLMSKETGSE